MEIKEKCCKEDLSIRNAAFSYGSTSTVATGEYLIVLRKAA